MPGRIDETPVRRATDLTRPEPSPGTPPSATGAPRTIHIMNPREAKVRKFAARLGRYLGTSDASPADGYVTDVLAAIALNQFNPEDYFPEEKLEWDTGVLAQGGAGTRSMLGIANNSRDKLAIIYITCVARRNTPGIIEVRNNQGNGAALVLGAGASTRDTRFPNPWSHEDIVIQTEALNGAASVGVLLYRTSQIANVPAPVPVFVMGPGNHILFQPDIDNEGLVLGWESRIISLTVG